MLGSVVGGLAQRDSNRWPLWPSMPVSALVVLSGCPGGQVLMSLNARSACYINYLVRCMPNWHNVAGVWLSSTPLFSSAK